jgi:putative ABC transport system permease protein
MANVANVLLAETVRRDTELAVRAALGASWLRLARQLLIETLVLSTVAVLVAAVFASWVLDAIASGVPYLMSFQALRPVSLDWRALACAALVGAASGTGAAALSIARARLVRSDASLRAGASGPPGHARARNTLTAVQLAVTLALLVGAGLLGREMLRQGRVDPGFNPDHLVHLVVQLPTWKYTEDAQARTALERLRDEALRVPGVTHATLSHVMPPAFGSHPLEDIEGAAAAPAAGAGDVSLARVDEAFFSTIGIPILAGRGFGATDRAGSLPVAIVSRSLGLRLWPDVDPLGRRFRESKDGPWLTVVGVAGDVARGGDQPGNRLAFYTPRSQAPLWWFEGLIVRTVPPPDQVAPALRTLTQQIMPEAPIIEVITAREALANANARVRFAGRLMTGVAGVALVLALVGVYGAFWCAVRQRTREIGVRIALGASPGNILRIVLGATARVTLTGLALGLPLALAGARGVESLLFEVSPVDPATFLAAGSLLAGAAIAASYLPARHAARIAPADVLRGS